MLQQVGLWISHHDSFGQTTLHSICPDQWTETLIGLHVHGLRQEQSLFAVPWFFREECCHWHQNSFRRGRRSASVASSCGCCSKRRNHHRLECLWFGSNRLRSWGSSCGYQKTCLRDPSCQHDLHDVHWPAARYGLSVPSTSSWWSPLERADQLSTRQRDNELAEFHRWSWFWRLADPQSDRICSARHHRLHPHHHSYCSLHDCDAEEVQEQKANERFGCAGHV